MTIGFTYATIIVALSSTRDFKLFLHELLLFLRLRYQTFYSRPASDYTRPADYGIDNHTVRLDHSIFQNDGVDDSSPVPNLHLGADRNIGTYFSSLVNLS